ncbi:hypothetical protein BaRGS_00017531 [Batillaria attramentaria]|uniref:Uncharacterized protein n=1 Tax=Batillaria attramentaria TaxID=370345 RepID=A0ABD0KWT4_9CAEN
MSLFWQGNVAGSSSTDVLAYKAPTFFCTYGRVCGLPAYPSVRERSVSVLPGRLQSERSKPKLTALKKPRETVPSVGYQQAMSA